MRMGAWEGQDGRCVWDASFCPLRVSAGGCVCVCVCVCVSGRKGEVRVFVCVVVVRPMCDV